MTVRRYALVAVTLACVCAGCSHGRQNVGILFGGQQTIDVSANGRTLSFGVPTCDGKPTVRVKESDEEVHLLVTSDTDNGEKCADGVSVTLHDALNSRKVIDDFTGEPVPTRRG